MDGQPDLVAALTSVATGAISVLLLYLGARRLGLTDLQKAVTSENERLILAMKERIHMLEKAHDDCSIENEKLKNTVESLQARVDGLEGKIADLILHTPVPRAPRAKKAETS